MKLKLFTLGFLLLPVFLFSQLKSSFDVVAGLDYSFRILNENSETPVVPIRESNEKARIKARFGFNYNIQVNKKLFTKTGLRLASVGYLTKESSNLRWGSEHDGMGGFINDPNLPDEVKLTKEYFFVEVPLAVRYQLSESKFSLFVEAGLSPNIYLTTRTKQDLEGEVTRVFSDNNVLGFTRLHIVGSASVGANYTLNDNWQIFGQPIARYHFTSLTRGNPVKENLYTLGLELGVRRFLK